MKVNVDLEPIPVIRSRIASEPLRVLDLCAGISPATVILKDQVTGEHVSIGALQPLQW